MSKAIKPSTIIMGASGAGIQDSTEIVDQMALDPVLDEAGWLAGLPCRIARLDSFRWP
jgi:hypothetical protein